jgi:hypothetical protein
VEQFFDQSLLPNALSFLRGLMYRSSQRHSYASVPLAGMPAAAACGGWPFFPVTVTN